MDADAPSEVMYRFIKSRQPPHYLVGPLLWAPLLTFFFSSGKGSILRISEDPLFLHAKILPAHAGNTQLTTERKSSDGDHWSRGSITAVSI